MLRQRVAWFACGAVLVALTFSDWYIPPESTPNNRLRGPAYSIVIGFLLASYIWFLVQTWLGLSRYKGIRRLELQFLAVTLALGAFLAATFAAAGNLLQVIALKYLSQAAPFAAFILCAWSICYYRIFDVRQVFGSLLHRAAMTAVLTVVAVFLARALDGQVSEAVGQLMIVGVLCVTVPWLDRKSSDWFGTSNDKTLLNMRRSVIEAALTEPQFNRLVTRFEGLLHEQSGLRFAILAFISPDGFRAEGIHLGVNRPAYVALCELGWATPEMLQRRPSSAALDDLRELLRTHAFGLVVTVPRGSPTPSLLVALGTKINEWPFTYPEVERLQNIAELMDNILTHSRLTAQAALQAKMEHLAMMSRGLAHDLKNLITPVSSFLIHTDGRYEPNSAEAEVHAAARRSMRVITDYVREAMFFSERLEPRLERVDLRVVFEAVRELTAARAAMRGVTVTTISTFTDPITADGVLLQRLLANLVSNAIDASARGQTVALSASNSRVGWVRLQVSDEGRGIPPENLGRIFDPYFTTKEFGEDLRGFGLGLTICQKITNLHGGKIAVRSEPSRGACVTVDLPTRQPAQGLPPAQPGLALP